MATLSFRDKFQKDRYESVEDLPDNLAKTALQHFRDSEVFRYGIEYDRSGLLYQVRNTLVLSNQRILAVSTGLVTDSVESYELDSLSRIEFTTGVIDAEIEVSGSGFDESFSVDKSHGQEFVTHARQEQ